MFRRLTAFAERSPVGAAKVIGALVVALVLIAIGVLASMMDLGSLFEPPYPSETTPLSWADGSIVWTETRTIIFKTGGGAMIGGSMDTSELYAMTDGWGRNYSDLAVRWEVGPHEGAIGGAVANESIQLGLNRGHPMTAENVMGGTFSDDGKEIRLSLIITDLLGNGAFDRGDRIAFATDPNQDASFYKDGVYTVAIAYLGMNGLFYYVGEFSFAFHEGRFYSWESEELYWQTPWYEW